MKSVPKKKKKFQKLFFFWGTKKSEVDQTHLGRMSLAVGMTSGSGGGANGVALHGEH